MLELVRTYIAQQIGLRPEAHVLVALSGGADSTALLLVLGRLGYRTTALHCNFHLRGAESDGDQAFVEQLCREQNVPLLVKHFQTERVARERGVSLEMAARDLRYDWFRQQLTALKADCIAVAHHQDDQAETLLLNLLRGTGLRGLVGMQPVSEGIIRPLLGVSRAQICEFLTENGQKYVTDSTNAERVAQRNCLRLDVLPLLKQINPLAVEHLCRACDNVRQSLPLYEEGVRAAEKRAAVTPERFPLEALRETALLHEWLRNKGFNRQQEVSMREADKVAVGGAWQSAEYQVLRDRTALLAMPCDASDAMPRLGQEEVAEIGETGPWVAYFDADLLREPLQVRRVQNGDFFVPFGMKGRKLVSDFLTDRKISLLEKRKMWVVTCGNDIIWLIGQRSDNRFRVTENTSHILRLTVPEP